jgi:hypothetical protein
MTEFLEFKYRKGIREIYPTNRLVKNWMFRDGEEDEASLAQTLATVAEKNGITPTEMMSLFPFVLRMIKSNSDWSK